MALRDDFLQLFRAARAGWLEDHDKKFLRAIMDEDSTYQSAMKLRRRQLLDLPASINGQTRAQLVALWPVEFGHLPLWFTNPAQAATLDPPGQPCGVDLGGDPPAQEGGK